MPLKSRRFLFYTFLLMFLMTGAIIIFYSFGWRLNPQNFRLQKVGGIFIETTPRNAEIKINGKWQPNKSNIIQKGTLISNLLPVSYNIEVGLPAQAGKTGYRPYYKKVKVEPSMVTEVAGIILLPDNIKSETIIPRPKGNVIIDSADNKIIVKNEKSGVYYLYNIADVSTAFNLNAFINNVLGNANINNIKLLPFDTNKIIADNGGQIYVLDTVNLSSEKILKQLPLRWSIKNSNLYFARKDISRQGNKTEVFTGLYSYNLIFKNEELLLKISKEIASAGVDKIEASEASDKILFSDKNGGLFLFSRLNKNLEKIAHSVKDFSFSPDNKKIAFLDKDGLPAQAGKISVQFLEDWNKGIRKKAGDVIRLELENKNVIKNIAWYEDSYHLLITYPDKVVFSEIDDRPPLNYYELINDFSDSFYDAKNNELYFIDGKKLQKTRIE